MDDKAESALKKYRLAIEWPEDQARKVTSVINSPEMQTNRRETRQLMNKSILRQVHQCELAQVEVVRQENVVTLNWMINVAVESPDDYCVCGAAWEIKLVPDAGRLDGGVIVSKNGNGSVCLELEQGCAYYFQFSFMHKDDIKSIQATIFQVAIPLSDERKSLLRKAVGLDLHPEERVRHKMQSFLDKQDAFDEMTEKAIERIKAKELPPDEERDRIEDFNDYAKSVKDQLGM